MVGIIVISDNLESREMLKSARRLVGRMNGFASVMLKAGTGVGRMERSLKSAIKKVDSHGGVLLLSDFYGSTQCNVCLKFLKKGVVELLTGFNLPMLVKLGTLNEKMRLPELVTFIERYGKDHIQHYVAPKINFSK